MQDDIITFLMGYAIASFVVTALFVRLGQKTELAAKNSPSFLFLSSDTRIACCAGLFPGPGLDLGHVGRMSALLV